MVVRRISVFGLGKLGLPMAACLAHKGYSVIGVDINANTVQAVNGGESPLYEPGVDDLIQGCKGNLSATNDYRYAVENSEVSFVFVPTPSNEDGGFSSKHVEACSRNIAEVLKTKDSFHLIALRSTVSPGITDGTVRPLIESISGRRYGEGFGLCYNPEFLALGSVIKNFFNPDFVLIGESDKKSGKILAEIYQTVCDNSPPIVRTNVINAEISKIALNCYITMKISFANTVAEICERVPGADCDTVSNVLGLDSRIGRKFLSGGLAYGGPCFPRDIKALGSFIRTTKCGAILPEAIERINTYQTKRIVRLVRKELGGAKDKRVAFLGLTYKPETDIVEPSAPLDIARALVIDGAKLHIYDPAGMGKAKDALGEEDITYVESARECLTHAEFCILATPWKEFNSLRPEDFIETMDKPAVFDCWRVLAHSEFASRLRYLAIGIGDY